MRDGKASELYIHEWIAVITITGFVGVLAFCAYLSSPPLITHSSVHQDPQDDLIEVFVTGSVVHPGPQTVPRGASIAAVLEAAVLLPEAETKNLSFQAKVRPNQTIKVREKKRGKLQVRRGAKGVKDVKSVKGVKD